MTIDDLQILLASIPDDTPMNRARRAEIIRQILQMSRETAKQGTK